MIRTDGEAYVIGGDFSGFDLPADIYADGIGQVDNLGHNFRSVFFVWTRSRGVLTKIPVLCLIRPTKSLTGGAVNRELERQAMPAIGHGGGLH